jgi:hypothetical protein
MIRSKDMASHGWNLTLKAREPVSRSSRYLLALDLPM